MAFSPTIRISARAVFAACLCGSILRAADPSDADLPALREAARSGRTVDRRRAARKLLRLGARAKIAIFELVGSDDVVIRRAALRRIAELPGVDPVPALGAALGDPSPLVRVTAVEELLAVSPRTKRVEKLLGEATKDGDLSVRKVAADAFWTFHRDVAPLRKRTAWDHAIEVIARLPLPKTGWKFRTDPGGDGHVGKWFDPALDESDWIEIEIEKFWHDAEPEKVGQYLGIGWYRTTVTAPPKPEGAINQVILRFESVDESTWLWINGEYAGVHDIGPGGWRTTFDLDITPFLRWGQANQITVRVLNTAGAGGIYKPVELQVLR